MTDTKSAAGDEINYGSYLMLDELLRLQRPRSTPEHPDEMLFIVVHQASELWFRCILHELDMLVTRMTAFDTLGALTSVKRINSLVSIVSQQLSALETLPPQRFAEFRGYLGSSTGSQSIQFRAIEAASGLRDTHFLNALAEHGATPPLVQQWLDKPTLQDLFTRMVEHEGTTIDALYRAPEPTALWMLAEALMEYEQGFGLWRFIHVQLVERIIGPDTGGTGGTLGARYLAKTVSQRFFPSLWKVRSNFFGAPK